MIFPIERKATIIFFVGLLFAYFSDAAPPSSQRDALVQIWNALNGPSWSPSTWPVAASGSNLCTDWYLLLYSIERLLKRGNDLWKGQTEKTDGICIRKAWSYVRYRAIDHHGPIPSECCRTIGKFGRCLCCFTRSDILPDEWDTMCRKYSIVTWKLGEAQNFDHRQDEHEWRPAGYFCRIDEFVSLPGHWESA